MTRQYLSGGVRVTEDPLGYGLLWFELQFLPPGKTLDRARAGMIARAESAMDVGAHYSLPFRLYGTLIGGQLSGDARVADLARATLQQVSEFERKNVVGRSPHSTINKVMFATALDPYAMSKWPEDSTLNL